MKHIVFFQRMLFYSTLVLSFFIIVSFSKGQESIISNPNRNTGLEQIRTDGTQVAPSVRAKVAANYHIQTSAVTTCYYLETTAEGHFHYRYGTATVTGSAFVTSIIGEEVEACYFVED